MTNDVLVHLNGMNKMEDFSHDEWCLHLSYQCSHFSTTVHRVIESTQGQMQPRTYFTQRIRESCSWKGHVHTEKPKLRTCTIPCNITQGLQFIPVKTNVKQAI